MDNKENNRSLTKCPLYIANIKHAKTNAYNRNAGATAPNKNK